jgi:tape measure domain-containing protein
VATSIGSLAVYLSADTGSAEKKLAGFSTNVDKFDRKMRSVGSAEPRMKGLDAAEKRMKGIDRIEERHRGRVAGGGKAGGAAGKVIGEQLAGASGLGDIVGAAQAGGPWAAAAVAGIAAVTAAAMGLKKALDLAGEARANAKAFEILTGSAEKGRMLTAALDEYAAKTAFSSRETAELGKRLLAVGIEADQVMPALKTFGDISAVLGGDTGETMRKLTKAFGDVRAAGRMTGEELNQFNEANVNIGEALAKTMGKPVESIKKLASEGEIGFGDVTRALNSLVAEGGKFAGGAEAGAKQWNGLMGQYADATDVAFKRVGEAVMEDLHLEEVLQTGLDVLGEFPDVLTEMRPGLKFFGESLRAGAKVTGDLVTAGVKLHQVMGAAGKAFFAPEMKQLGEFMKDYKLTLADLEKFDLQGAMVGGAKDGLAAVKPSALAAADWIDAAVTGYRRLDHAMRTVDATGKGTFKVLGEGFKAVADPLDNLIGKLSVLGDILRDPTKALDLPKALEAAAGAVKGFKPEFKFDFGKIDLPPAVVEDHATRKRLEQGFAAAEGGIKGIETERAHDKAREQLGRMADAMRASGPHFEAHAAALDRAAGRLDKFGHGLDAGAEKLSAHLRDEATKLGKEYADPLAALFKKADDLDKMRQFGAITADTHALAFGAEADKLLKLKGEPNRPAPAVEYGTREFAQVVQAATARGGQRDLLSAVQQAAELQKEAVRVANQQLDELRKIPRPRVVKLGGE